MNFNELQLTDGQVTAKGADSNGSFSITAKINGGVFEGTKLYCDHRVYIWGDVSYSKDSTKWVDLNKLDGKWGFEQGLEEGLIEITLI